MILSDNPIQTEDKDQLRRLPLATKIAELIANFEGKESFVIGIEGPWGSGKTSFVNLIQRELEKSENVVILNFNPWNFSGQNELIEDFFASLSKKVEPLLTTDGTDFQKLKKYASKLTRKGEFSLNPEISFLGLSLKAGELKKFGGDITLQEEREEIDGILKRLPKKIVVVLDDLDRLDKLETRLIMKLVKMTANFPNTIFLLAYDREKVAARLEEDGWPGEEYLKKIIQVSFTLPEPDRQGLNKILFKDLDETIKEVYGEVVLEGKNEKRWREISYAGFPLLFKTIRDIKRYIGSLRLNWSIMGKDDINMIDFMSIEAIRVFSPHFYSAISANKSLFTGTTSFYAGLSTRDDDATKNKLYNELLQKADKEVRNIIDKICRELFPQVDPHSGYGHDWQEEWRKDRRVCAEERFGFYFQLGIPEGAVSETEILGLIKTLTTKENFSKTILKFANEDRTRPILSKLLDHISELTADQVKILILSLWSLQPQIAEDKKEVFDFNDVPTQISRLTYQGIKHAVPKEKRPSFIESLVQESENFYNPAYLVTLMIQMLEKRPEDSEDVLVSAEEIEGAKKMLLEKIKSAAESRELDIDKNFAFFLYRWKDWEGDQPVKNYIEKLLQTRNGLLLFLKGFVVRVLSTGGDYNKIDKKSLADFTDLKNLEKLVVEIKEEEIKALGEKEQEAIALFKNPKKEW